MKKEIIILGSTGSIGTSTLAAVKNENFKIKLLSTNKNILKIYKQAIEYNVKDIIVADKTKYKKYKYLFKKKKIRLHLGFKNIDKILKKKITYCINSITGIDGLEPTLKVIPFTNNLLLANKESIICAWEIIKKNLKKFNTNFIPIDSEHFSILQIIKNEKLNNIDQIILTASGGPFYKKSKKNIINIKPKVALRHPIWKMGKKISIDSSTMMNKIFEFIEAKNIFNLRKKNISILVHPTSFVHAIVFFKGGLIKFLAHDPKMIIPISNALNIKKKINKKFINNSIDKINSICLKKIKKKDFPLIKIIDLIPEENSYFETILITLNDELVNKYLNGDINYISIQNNLLNLIKNPYFSKFYKLKPKNIYDINRMISDTKIYLEKKIKYYEK